MVAGCSAMLTLDEAPDGSAVVSAADQPLLPVTPKSTYQSFACARSAPVMWGASEDGQLISVMYMSKSRTINIKTAPAIAGVHVKTVNAAANLTIVFTCTNNIVWMINLENLSSLCKVGVTAKGRVLAAFAAADVAVAVLTHPTKSAQLLVLSLEPRVHWAWDYPNPDTILDPPDWAKCCACHLCFDTVTAFIGGSLVVAAQLKAVLAGPQKSRAKIIMSARQQPVVSIAVLNGQLLCLQQDGRLLQLSDRGRRTLKTCRALTDTGHTI